MAHFPQTRLRRLRRTAALRSMMRETEIRVSDLIHPLFVIPGQGIKEEIESMPGSFHLSVDMLGPEAEEIAGLGIPAIILFGLPEKKDDLASGAYDKNGIIQRAIRRVKASVPDLVVITDVCLCQYMSHGHCGVVEDGQIVNDRSVELIARTALSHAEAGADIVAPSDMMDGRVKAIRASLDDNGFPDTIILSYAAKYDSAFYGPFRDAADSTPQFGNRSQYQMDKHNVREALREVQMDIEEGADMVMVKPALPYLDVISKVRQKFDLPLAAYNVSGEFAMIKAAAANGWLDEERAAMEVLTAIKRAGADLIITYSAKDAARWLKSS